MGYTISVKYSSKEINVHNNDLHVPEISAPVIIFKEDVSTAILSRCILFNCRLL